MKFGFYRNCSYFLVLRYQAELLISSSCQAKILPGNSRHIFIHWIKILSQSELKKGLEIQVS